MNKKKIIGAITVIAVLIGAVVGVMVWWDSQNDENEEAPISYLDNYNVVSKDNIILNKDNYGYINNIIMVSVDFMRLSDEEQEEKVLEVCELIDGRIVGQVGPYWKVQIPPKSLEELKELCKEIEKIDGVMDADCNEVFPLDILQSSNNPPNDPWKDKLQGLLGVNWNEDKPSGLNWHLEAIQAVSAWDYSERFTNLIDIGVVDNGFDTKHKDLDITVLNEEMNTKDSHGTHVSGIIGAIPNNEKGITGIARNSNLYGFDVDLTEKQKKEYPELVDKYTIYYAVEQLIKNTNVKIINISMGNKKALDESEYEEKARQAVQNILYWCAKLRDDFIIVQGAGNKGIDAKKSGFFTTVTSEYATSFINDNNYQSYFSESDVMDRIIIVGGVDKASKNYKLLVNPDATSNYGSQISIVAPGESVFSTIKSGGITGNYGILHGTSMAAPIVSGVCALVWSVNDEFTPGEIKDIVCNYTKDDVRSNKKSSIDSLTYRMVNAKLAVEEAIRRTDGEVAVTFANDDSTDKPTESTSTTTTTSATTTTNEKTDLLPLDYEMREENLEFKTSSGILFFTNKITYPYFFGNSKSAKSLNKHYSDYIKKCKNNDTDFDARYNNTGDIDWLPVADEDLPLYINLEAKITYNKNGYISISDIETEWHGGNRPWRYQSNITMNISKGKKLKYSDLLTGNSKKIDNILTYYFTKRFPYYYSNNTLETLKKSTPFNLTNKGICFYYNTGAAIPPTEIIIPFQNSKSPIISAEKLLSKLFPDVTLPLSIEKAKARINAFYSISPTITDATISTSEIISKTATKVTFAIRATNTRVTNEFVGEAEVDLSTGYAQIQYENIPITDYIDLTTLSLME